MSNKTFIAFVITAVTVWLLIGGVLVGIDQASKPSGLALAERARAAQISREEAQTAITLSVASQNEANAKAEVMRAWAELFPAVAQTILLAVACCALPLAMAILFSNLKRG